MIRRYFIVLSLIGLVATGAAADEGLDRSTSLSDAEKALDTETEKLSLAELERRAAARDPKAQAELGARYGRGDGVPRNLERAVALLREAAGKNDADGQYFLGTAYSNGLGVPQDEAQALSFYKQAAAQHHRGAEFMVGSLMTAGRAGGPADWAAAIPYLWDSAAQGYPPAELLLGFAFHNGFGVERSPRVAAYWYRRTNSRVFNQRAQLNLATLVASGEVALELDDPGQPQDSSPR